MKFFSFLFFLIVALTLSIILLFAVKNNDQSSTVSIKNITFAVDVAKNDTQKEKGLSIYSKLPLNHGMIFPFFSSGYHSFWMKGMKFPIDIIYINNKKIVDIFKSVPQPKSDLDQPMIVRPNSTANLVLEINAGLSQKYNFKIGDEVRVKY